MFRDACVRLLAARDRSSLVLYKYFPAKLADGYLALKAFNLEIAKIADTARDPIIANAQMTFYKSGLQHAYKQSRVGTDGASSGGTSGGTNGGDTPSLQLLSHALKNGLNIPKRYPLTLIQTRERFLMHPPIRTIDDLGRIGEGTASQLIYASFDMLQAVEAGTSEFLHANPTLDELISTLLAHIGQAQGIASSLKAVPFYANQQNRLLLPIDILKKHNLTDMEVLQLLTSEPPNKPPPHNLQDAVFDVATSANDHILTARKLLSDFKTATNGKIPTSLRLSIMEAIPIVLYLESLQKNDFDLQKKVSNWKLPFRTWRAYNRAQF